MSIFNGLIKMRKFLINGLLVGMCFFALTGLAMADAFADATRVYDTGDYAQAVKLYRPLAENGNADAQYVLGMMYRAGRGVERDNNEAKKWYQLASEQGHPLAQFYLGWMHASGKGVPKDNVKGYMWISIAIANASGEARKEFIVDRDALAKSMTAEQVDQAQKLAKKCTAKKFKGC
ncbi:MAG TPA: tetratricopeptide repeat protein [Gallionella sp.]|nr:tetratricopeptide repeat protein [Gallionella sp.]